MNQQVLDLQHEHHAHGTFIYRFSEKEIFKIILQFILFCLGVPANRSILVSQKATFSFWTSIMPIFPVGIPTLEPIWESLEALSWAMNMDPSPAPVSITAEDKHLGSNSLSC